MNSKDIGNKAEDVVVNWLLERGFTIIERNYYASKLGEIDIVAKKEGTIHFIEVKSSFSTSYHPIYNITPKKLQRLINSAYYYIKSHNVPNRFCIDAVTLKQDGTIEYFPNITL